MVDREDRAVEFGASVGLLVGFVAGALTIRWPLVVISVIVVQIVLLARLVWRLRRDT